MVNDMNRRGVSVVIDVPACSSACTFFLLADDVCTSARTVYGFHGPQNIVFGYAGIPIRSLPTKRDRQNITDAINLMADNYDLQWPGLGDWFKEHAAHKFGWSQTYVKGRALHDAFGVPICEE